MAGLKRWFRLRNVLPGVAGMTLLLGVAGRSYQWITWSLDARRSPEAGRLVDTGRVRLQIHCMGEGSPTVLLESGLGDILEQWRKVQPAVASQSRVCSYDRAGYGNSDAGSLPRTSERIAEELHLLLRRAGERPPYVLVGHSAGGYHVRVFHGRYPAEVAGAVLVDATQEDQYRILPPAWKALGTAMVERYRNQARWAPLEVDLGIKRLMLSMHAGEVPYLLLQSKYFQARASELENIEVSAEQARAAGGFGGKPLIVLTGGKQVDGALRAGLTDGELAEFRRVWVEELQPRLVGLSSRGKWTVLPDSGHDVPADRPDAVIEAIGEVCEMARTK